MYFSIAVLSWKRQRILSRVSCWKSPSFWRFKSFKGFHAQQRSWPQSCMELETSFSFFVLNRKDHKISKMASFLTQGIWPSVWTAGRNSNGRPRNCTSLWNFYGWSWRELPTPWSNWSASGNLARPVPKKIQVSWAGCGNHIASIWRKYQKSIAWDAKPCGHHLHASERRGLPRAQSTDTNLKNANLFFFWKWPLKNESYSTVPYLVMNPQHQKMYVLQIGFKLSIFHPPGVEMRSKLSSKSTEKLEVSRSTEHIYIHCSRQHKNMPSDTHMYKRQRHVWESLLNHLHVPIRSSVCGLFKQHPSRMPQRSENEATAQ